MKIIRYFIALWLTVPISPAAAAEPLRIAAAASLRPALQEIARQYEAEANQGVRISWAASRVLRRQIAGGAPFDVFLSADERFVFDLAAEGHARDRGRVYARGRLALVAGRTSGLDPDPTLGGLAEFLSARPAARFAIANPSHAPYGRAAAAAIEALNLKDAIAPHLVMGENVSQAAQFVATRSAAAGLVSLSLALISTRRGDTRHAVVPETLYPPLNHRMAVLQRAQPGAAAFYAFMTGGAARAALVRYGFELPEGPGAQPGRKGG
ncbi:MAG: molybdate ABC transporter substrate-binding protein [Rhodospirillaceae bacterium]